MENRRIKVYTDGGCRPNPGVGGWGAVILMPDGKIIELSGVENPSNGERMELMAAIAALEFLEPGSNVLLRSDNMAIVGGIKKRLDVWRENGWITSTGRPVSNRELWERLDLARRRHQVKFKWVPGHAGIEHNERADALARKGAMDACGHADFEHLSLRAC